MDDRARSPFGGIKIVECGEGVPAAFAAKMFADIGAEVVKVESPAGDVTRRRGPFPGDQHDPEKSGLFIYLNANKRGVVADLEDRQGRDLLARLLEGADILIHNVTPTDRSASGLDSAALCDKYPRLIVASISLFGDRGPYAGYKGYELTASNAGGWANLTPGASADPELSPLKCFGSQCEFQAGVHAALTTFAAWLHRLESGKGQAIDVSEQEVVVSMLEQNLVYYTYAGREASRLGARLIGPWFVADCIDGKIMAFAAEEDQWQRLVELMGNPEWAADDLFKDRFSRGANMDALKALMTEWISKWRVQDLYQAAQKKRIPFAPINTMRDLYENTHLRERGFFVRLEQPGVGEVALPGMPSRYGATEWSLRRPAPRLGEHNEEIFSGELGIPKEQMIAVGEAGVT